MCSLIIENFKHKKLDRAFQNYNPIQIIMRSKNNIKKLIDFYARIEKIF